MKPALTLFFRDSRTGKQSIERLFSSLTVHFEKVFEVDTVHLPNRPGSVPGMAGNIKFARKKGKGVLHITGDAHYIVPFLKRGATVLTIHDCGYLKRLRGIKKFLYKLLWFRLPCRFAQKVTVISEATREDLEKEIGPLGDKLVVIENCFTFEPQAAHSPFNSGCPKILQIGSGRHKNLDTLITAVDDLPCELKIVGKLSDENRRELDRRKIQYTNEFAVSDSRIQEIYQECDILFFASRLEGFGLPILEAQAFGIPCITSNCSSMPGVAGEGALLVDPESPEEIRSAIERLKNEPRLREELFEKGRLNLQRFEPATIAQKYMDVFRTLGNG
ncbi:glycosyltransferase family 4 protein [Puniceicoccales bacterium CK1056]|uniref:Glycosyltransferase family 4 protein n=1 Tax=Oceanipulchritudo coccoides TaxID=2706888 RepID=A0A6B2M4L2_9BACT|nr:glycosyltransferase family 1 protein [Oceanipulchritudo coccoides]NDV63034.1 glycosyltransferase family 4 protein [Oceanipulchritudo coccoides]